MLKKHKIMMETKGTSGNNCELCDNFMSIVHYSSNSYHKLARYVTNLSGIFSSLFPNFLTNSNILFKIIEIAVALIFGGFRQRIGSSNLCFFRTFFTFGKDLAIGLCREVQGQKPGREDVLIFHFVI